MTLSGIGFGFVRCPEIFRARLLPGNGIKAEQDVTVGAIEFASMDIVAVHLLCVHAVAVQDSAKMTFTASTCTRSASHPNIVLTLMDDQRLAPCWGLLHNLDPVEIVCFQDSGDVPMMPNDDVVERPAE